MDVDTLGEDELRNEVKDLAELAAGACYHRESQSNIIYCLEIGTSGIRGIGPSPVKAFENFVVELESALKETNADTIRHWHQRLANRVSREGKLREFKAIGNAVSCSGNIGMFTTSEFYNKLENRTSKEYPDVSSLCRHIIIRQVEDIEESLISLSPANVRDMLSADVESTELKGSFGTTSKKKWVLRVSTETHARVLILANELGIRRSATVCYGLLARGLNG